VENYWSLGRWLGVSVSMHWTVLLALPWLYLMMGSLVAAIIAFAAFCIVLAVHEFGHAAVARWRGVYVQDVTLFGMHGQTSVGLGRKRWDDVLIAWGGVAAQLVLLLLTGAAGYWLAGVVSPWVWSIAAPVMMVFTKWNAFVMLVALLPIGPMDGHRAWQAIPLIRQAMRQSRKPRASGTAGEKVVHLTAAKRREYETRSQKAAADILRDLGKKK